MRTFELLLNPSETAPRGGVFGGGGGGGSNALSQVLLQQQMQQQQAQATNLQGQQLALLSKTAAQSNAETASLQKPGLGQALLTYRKSTSGTLGGG